MATYFVMHLTDRDLSDRGRPVNEKRFEIQMLDAQGRAEACGYVGPEDASLRIYNCVIPFAVIDAARRQAPGQGDYVGDDGNSVPAF